MPAIKIGVVISLFKRNSGTEKEGDFELTWLSGKDLACAEDFRIPWGSGMAGSSPSSLRTLSKDWEEIWREGMPYCLLWEY